MIQFLALRTRRCVVALLIVLCAGLIGGSSGISLAVAPALNQTGELLPPAGPVIVVLNEGFFTAPTDVVAERIGVEVELEFDTVFDGFATTATQTEISKLAANPNVDFIVEDSTFFATAQTPSTAISRIEIQQYAQIDGVDNPANVDIAILDTGIDAGHPDLTVVAQVNYSTDTTVQDLGGHGTHVAGIAGAIDNTSGVVGTAPGARLWNVKVLNSNNSGNLSGIVAGIEYSINQGTIEVINMSLAGAGSGTTTCANPSNDILHAAVCKARDAGILVVVAAGNDATDASSTIPAKYPEVVTVGNINDSTPTGSPGGDSYATSSNYGGVVDISAPGTGIFSTYKNGTYATLTGTSMSSPLVAGAGALYMSKTGGSASSAQSWLLGTASVLMSTENGCACSAPTGSPNRMLFLGTTTTVTNPTGQLNPSFSGSKIPIVSSSATMNSAASIKTWDGSTASNWTSGTTPTGQVILTLDLGSERDISGVKWMTAFNGYADQFTVRGMNSAYQSTTLGTFGNPGQSRTFYGVSVTTPVVVRWIKFYFDNPNQDSVVGSISEIEIWQKAGTVTTNSTGTANPVFSGSKQTIVGSTATMNSGMSIKTWDGDTASNWTSGTKPTGQVILTVDLGSNKDISGVKWMTAFNGYADEFTVRTMNTAYQSTTLGTFGNPGSSRTFYGVATNGTVSARWVKFYFNNPNDDHVVGSISEIEIFGGGATGASAASVASPVASPVALESSPFAGTPVVESSPDVVEASPAAGTPVAGASPDAVTSEEPTQTPTETPTEEPTETPTEEPTETPTETPTEEPTQTPTETPTEEPALAPTETPTEEPTQAPTETPTEEPTATPTEEPTQTPTEEPTQAPTEEPTEAPAFDVTTGTITGTGGDSVNCRISAVDGEPITQLVEGESVAITGPEQDGWYPVLCGGESGFVASQFVTIGEVPIEEPATGEPIEDEPTAEPTEAVVVAAYPIVGSGDTENSGTSSLVSDGDASSVWQVTPNQNLEQARLYVDLGQVVPIDRIGLILGTWDQLPIFEVWLSVDGEIWYNATPGGISGWNLPRGEVVEIRLGYDARYVRIVIPDVDEQLGAGVPVGGIGELQVWPGDSNQTLTLGVLGGPTTPTPADLPPTEEVIEESLPTEEPIVPTEEALPTEEPVVPTEEPLPTESG